MLECKVWGMNDDEDNEPVGDECKGESDEANRAAEDDAQGNQSTLLIPDGRGSDRVALRLRRRESMDMTSVQGFHLQNEYQINSDFFVFFPIAPRLLCVV